MSTILSLEIWTLTKLCFIIVFHNAFKTQGKIQMSTFHITENAACINSVWDMESVTNQSLLQCNVQCMTSACVGFTYQDGRCSFVYNLSVDIKRIQPNTKCVMKVMDHIEIPEVTVSFVQNDTTSSCLNCFTDSTECRFLPQGRYAYCFWHASFVECFTNGTCSIGHCAFPAFWDEAKKSCRF